ncbi:hypothetical protein [Streptomyces werraensis]|uniref:hypothetical protein n=1 Tax=Streptomyces werraensis TaxID=68284 RepID=UPI0037D334BF
MNDTDRRGRRGPAGCGGRLDIVVPSPTGLRAVPVADLLPHTYVWADHQLDTPSNGGPT